MLAETLYVAYSKFRPASYYLYEKLFLIALDRTIVSVFKDFLVRRKLLIFFIARFVEFRNRFLRLLDVLSSDGIGLFVSLTNDSTEETR